MGKKQAEVTQEKPTEVVSTESYDALVAFLKKQSEDGIQFFEEEFNKELASIPAEKKEQAVEEFKQTMELVKQLSFENVNSIPKPTNEKEEKEIAELLAFMKEITREPTEEEKKQMEQFVAEVNNQMKKAEKEFLKFEIDEIKKSIPTTDAQKDKMIED